MNEQSHITISTFVLIDTTIDKLPLREKDGSRVLDGSKNVYKIYSEVGATVFLKQEKGIEQQFRQNCKK